MAPESSVAEPKIDGRIINASYSTCAPGIRPSFFRYVRHDSLFKLLLTVAFVLFLVGVGFGGAGEALEASTNRVLAGLGSALMFAGGLVVLLAVGILFLTRMLWKKTAEFFENGLLTPGIVLSPLPLEVAVMASMNNGAGEACWGIRRLKLSSLPVHSHDTGTRVPFVSTFVAGDRHDRWADFLPTPISYGSGSRKRIERCAEKLGQEDFDKLAECIRHGLVPFVEEEMILVDQHMKRLETISRGRRAAS